MFKISKAASPTEKSSSPDSPQRPKSIWHANGGIYLGYGSNVTQGNPPPIEPHNQVRYTGDRHIITIGPNGSGKTIRLLAKNLYYLTNWSVVVIDPKAELAYMTAEHRRRNGNNVMILNPYNSLKIPSTRFNPITSLDDDVNGRYSEFADDAFSLADAVIRIPPESNDPHWAESAQDLVTALIMYAKLTTAAYQDGKLVTNGNFAFVRKSLGQSAGDFVKTIRKMIAAGKKYGSEELVAKASRFVDINAENRELNSILSTAMTQTRWLDSPAIKHDLAGRKFDFSELKYGKKPTTIYLCLPAKRLGTQSAWLRLIITSIVQNVMRDVRRGKHPVLLMLDEAAQLGHMPVIESQMPLMRGYGLKMWSVYQDLTQPSDIYQDRWESMMGNAGVINSFAPQDTFTSQHLSDLIGMKSIESEQYAVKTAIHDTEAREGTVTTQLKERPYFYPQELRDIDEGFMVYLGHNASLDGRHSAWRRMYVPWTIPGMEEIDKLQEELANAE